MVGNEQDQTASFGEAPATETGFIPEVDNQKTTAIAPSDRPEAVHPAWHIAVISASILVLELAFIRLVPAEVHALSYFTNLILMAAFFGMGLGCILQKQRSLNWLLPTGLFCLFAFVMVGRGIVVYEDAVGVHYWLQNAPPGSATGRLNWLQGVAPEVPLFGAAMLVFILAAMPFVAQGQLLARTMDRFPRLQAYSWDIIGSLAGTLLFVSTAALCVPPWIWPPVVGFLWAWLFVRKHALKVLYALSGIAFFALMYAPYDSAWSPYYYIQHHVKDYGILVWVNSSFHQLGVDFTADDEDHRRKQESLMYKWGKPYQWYRDQHNGQSPRKVLLLGTGTGNDVYVALQNNAEDITAVEIDPVILELGRTGNKMAPYDDPRVNTVVDDARHFLKASDETFDMIVFGTLDSQVLLSSQANLRLENYVYTVESLRDARERLADDGFVVVHYSVFKPWLLKRIYSTVREAFGNNCRLVYYDNNVLFNTTVVAARGGPGFGETEEVIALYGNGIPSTDNWPFIYLEAPVVPGTYLKLFGVILTMIFGAFLLLRRLHPTRGLHVDYLFLGLGFTLMESSAIVRLALLFGCTWTVNAVVFSAVLSTIFLANYLVIKERALPLKMAWRGVLGFILVNFLLPVDWLGGLSTPGRVMACVLLVGAPVFCAATCFSHLFKREKVTGYPLGINLIGAMAGGVVEYLSMAWGMRSVWIVVFGVYLFACIAATHLRKSTAAA